ncbi:hypothetical protein LTR78_001897 [Recurvomyces mirabilis]|uniref:Uncharacterized protein n=2 Tax=Recurvomyces mirabilis TaxID=574656 RepID=A0AAE0WVI1_9PEZI|nr:hypothetical protein LTR78_001897 [Recurvomyces mirabilis]
MAHFLRLTPRRITTSLISIRQPLVARSFSIAPQLRLKEDGDRSAEELEKKKQQQLQKQRDGKAEWHESLASAGESNIAADKEKVNDHGKHMEDLQKETASQSEKEHPDGKK